MKKTVLLMALLLTTVVGMAKSVKTLVVTTQPQMHCANCENRIKGNLRFEKGVKRIETSVPDQTVTIDYDENKTSEEQLVKAFEKIGYQVQVLRQGETAPACAGHECKGNCGKTE